MNVRHDYFMIATITGLKFCPRWTQELDTHEARRVKYMCCVKLELNEPQPISCVSSARVVVEFFALAPSRRSQLFPNGGVPFIFDDVCCIFLSPCLV